MTSFLYKRRALIAWLFMAAAVVAAISLTVKNNADQVDATRTSQLAGCVRTNELRSQINRQSSAFLVHNEVTLNLFASIAKTGGITPKIKTQIDSAVKSYRHIEHEYSTLSIIDCAKAYPTSTK